jgi:group II intron reverse transcriptase/maturase
MGNLLDRAFSEQRLLDAWREVRDAAMADGDAGPEVEHFEAAAARHVSELAASLSAGTFQPHPVVRAELAKPSGGTRRLAIPCLADRIVERALLAELDPVIDPLLLPWSFAYRHGLGVRDAVACLAEARDSGATWVTRCDIDDCFEQIPRWEVMRRLREVVTDVGAVDLIRRFMDRPVLGEHVARPERGLGLHQGSSLSPLLSNLYLDAFDRAMLAAGYRAIRYSDDVAIPVADRGAAEHALADAAQELDALRLRLDPVKSQVVSFDSGVPFLGSTVTSLTSPGATTTTPRPGWPARSWTGRSPTCGSRCCEPVGAVLIRMWSAPPRRWPSPDSCSQRQPPASRSWATRVRPLGSTSEPGGS